MPQSLPTFRPLASHAASLHLSLAPYDGAALIVSQALPVTPLLDGELLLSVQVASASLEGAIAALAPLRHLPAVASAYASALTTRHAYHVAIMAGFGVDVCERRAE